MDYLGNTFEAVLLYLCKEKEFYYSSQRNFKLLFDALINLY
jgi:hypothetical protein